MKNKVIFFLCFMSFLSAFSQEPPQKKVDIDELIDDFLVQDESLDVFMASMTNFHLLYVSVNYNSNTYFSGRDIGIDQYNLVPQITYMHSKGFYGSLSGIYYSEFDPNWDVTTTTVGFGKSFGKNITSVKCPTLHPALGTRSGHYAASHLGIAPQVVSPARRARWARRDPVPPRAPRTSTPTPRPSSRSAAAAVTAEAITGGRRSGTSRRVPPSGRRRRR